MKSMMIRVPGSWYHTVYALDEFNVCEAINCGPLNAKSLKNALKIINVEISHDTDKTCKCEDLLNQGGDSIAMDLNRNDYIQKIKRQIQQLTTSEYIKNKINAKDNSLFSSLSENRRNASTSIMDFDENQELKDNVQLQHHSPRIVSKLNVLFNKLRQDLVDNRNEMDLNSVHQTSVNGIQQNVVNDDDSNRNQQISSTEIQQSVVNDDDSNETKYQHNDQIEDRTLTHIDRLSGETFKCIGWIWKGRTGRIRKRKNVICHFCPTDNEKTFDDNNLRAHLESKHFNVKKLKIKSLVFLFSSIHVFS